MSTTLLEQIEQRGNDEQANARRQYAELIQRADHPRKGDADTLASVMRLLGIDADRLRADLSAVREATRLEAAIVPESEIAENRDKAAELGSQLQNEGMAWYERERALNVQITASEAKVQSADKKNDRSRERIDQLKREHWLAFGMEPRVDPPMTPEPTPPPLPARQDWYSQPTML